MNNSDAYSYQSDIQDFFLTVFDLQNVQNITFLMAILPNESYAVPDVL